MGVFTRLLFLLGMKKKFPIESVLSHDMFYEVGLQLITAAHAENAISLQILRFFNEDRKMMPVLDGMAISVKLRVLHEVAVEQVGVARAEPVGKLCDQLRRRFDHRNDLAHEVLSKPPDGQHHHRILKMETNKRDGPRKITKTTPAQVRENTSGIYSDVEAIALAITEIGVPPLRED